MASRITRRFVRQSAFTSIELLVVIGIIALLLALLLPVLNKVRASARVTTCASNLRQIVLMLRVYSQDNDGRLPYRSLGLDDWSSALVPLSRGRGVYRCPDDDNPRRDTPGLTDPRSYGVNCGPFAPAGSAVSFRAPWPVIADAPPVRLHQVPGHVFLVGDNHGQFPQSAAWVGFAEAEALDGIAWGTHRLKGRHGDNYGFSDGRVEYRLKEELDQLTADPDADPGGGPADTWKWR
jgi:type II secretory pathway pseudopilin PulG